MHRLTLTTTVLFAALVAMAVLPALGCGGSDTTPSPTATPSPTPMPPPAPTVTSVAPAAGFTAGGTMITVSGTNFTGGGTPTVSLGGANATSVVVVNATTLTAVTAATAAFGPVAVTVTNTAGAGNLAGGFTYVRYPPVADPLGDLQVDTDAMTRFSDGERPQIVCQGNRVYVGWVENRGGPTNDVFFNRSLDGGSTWDPVDTLVSVGAAPASRFGLRMCASGNNVYATWVDDRTGALQVHFNRSLDAGATWLAADVPIFHTAASQQFYHSICCDGLNVHVVWPDDRNGPGLSALFGNRSTDGGTTFLPADVTISAPPGFPLAPQTSLCCEGSRVITVWADFRTGDGNVWLNRSTDNGATWQAADTRVDTDAGVANASDPALCCSGNNVYVAWVDARNGGLDVYFNRSADGGLNFAAADQRVNTSIPGSVSAQAVSICCEGGTAHVAWIENRNAGMFEPFTRRTVDAGLTFAGPDVRLNRGVAAGTVGVRVPLPWVGGLPICCENGNVHVAWTDARNAPRFDVFMNSSPDGGATWGATDVRLDTDVPMVGDTLQTPALCCDGPIAHASWWDDRNNLGSFQGDVAYNRTVP